MEAAELVLEVGLGGRDVGAVAAAEAEEQAQGVDLEDGEVGGAGRGEGEALLEGDEELLADVGAAREAAAFGQEVAPALAAGLVGGALGEECDEGEADGDDVSIRMR